MTPTHGGGAYHRAIRRLLPTLGPLLGGGGGAKQGGNATSPLHSRGSPTKGTKSNRAQKWAEMLHHPCILGGPRQRAQNQSGPKRGRKCYITPAFSRVPNKGDKIKAAQKEAGNATSPLHSWGSPTKGTKSNRAQKRAEMLHHHCILGGPQQRGQNQSGPKRGRKCYITPAYSGFLNKGDKIKAPKKKQQKNLKKIFYCVLDPAWVLHVAPTGD